MEPLPCKEQQDRVAWIRPLAMVVTAASRPGQEAGWGGREPRHAAALAPSQLQRGPPAGLFQNSETKADLRKEEEEAIRLGQKPNLE